MTSDRFLKWFKEFVELSGASVDRPPHNLQTAEVVFTRSLYIYYNHSEMVVTLRQVVKQFSKAFVQAAIMTTATNGFKTTGIWPHDPNVFSVLL